MKIFERNSLRAMCLFTFCWSSGSAIYAQTAPQVVTLLNGTQYIGQTVSVAEFSAEQPNPWGSKRIALVDDGLRRVFFHQFNAGNVSPLSSDHPLANPTEFIIPQRTYNGKSRGYGQLSFGPFNEYGHRVVRTVGPDSNMFVQGITKITPYYCVVETLANADGNKIRNWTMPIATSTIPAEVIRNLLESKIRDRKNPADYLSIVDFFRESQKYQMALNELAFVAERFPDMKDVIEEQQKVIRQARARQWIREVNRHIDVGQPRLAKVRLGAFDRGGIAGEILAEMATIQTRLEKADERIQNTGQAMVEILDRVLQNPAESNVEDDQVPMLESFKRELESELNIENVNRLDAVARFLSDPQMNDLQKLSLAISGWYLGSNNATENFAVSQSFEAVRNLVIEYLTTADPGRRAAIVEELKKYEGGEPEYLARMVAQMKPPKAPDLKNHDLSQPLEFNYTIDGVKGEKLEFRYFVQLPPEYTPYRRYPCIVTLPGDKKIERQMTLWCGRFNQKLGINVGQATRNGYIVVGIDWKRPGQFEYEYSAIEHQTIMNAYRKVLQQFSIDTDRIFLTGHGFGADAAYDIGISHPEHWAGVVGISGKIQKYPEFYRDHRHFPLAVYSVVGERDLPSIKASEATWNKWLNTANFANCTVVEYKGRSNEFFVEEIVEIFKWASGHRRRLPDLADFQMTADVRRPWDNYFWFYELLGIPAGKIVWPELFETGYEKGFPSPVTMTAKLQQPNKFIVGPSKQGDAAIIWLSPEFVDLNQRIRIGEGSRGKKFNDFVTPSRQVLLEDVRLRGDRQHPYWCNLYCGEGNEWRPNIVPER